MTDLSPTKRTETPMDNVALDRLYRMAREWESGVEYRDDENLDDWAEGKLAGYNSCARDLLAFVEYQRDVEADKTRQGEHNDAHPDSNAEGAS